MIFSFISFIISILVVWIIASVPVWFAAKIIVGKNSSFGQALATTLLGSIVFFVFFYIFSFLIIATGGFLGFLGGLIGFIAVISVFKGVYNTGWVGAFLLALVSVVLAVIIFFILSAFLFLPLRIEPVHVMRLIYGFYFYR
ncbi:MAG: hypothetical protein ACP5UV_02460 [Thermoplasmata archaeon]